MKLSVIVPVYNMEGEGKLRFCLESLVNQTLREKGVPYEILAVDDASTDGSLEVLREYESRYPGLVRVFAHPVNKRQGGAKNTGLAAARGVWVGFVDSDDWVSPDCYEKLLGKARESGADLVGCDYCLVREHTFTPGETVQNNHLDQTGAVDLEKRRSLLIRPGSMVIKIYRRQVITENGLDFPEGIFYEDNCAGTVWALYFQHFEKVEEPLYYYYQHQASTVHRVTRERCRDRMQAARLMLEECRRRGFAQIYGPEIEYRFTELYYAVTLFSYMLGVKIPRLSFVKELKRGVLEEFPRFQENPYYQKYTGQEQKSLIALQVKSDWQFFWWYLLKIWVRRAKKALGRSGRKEA